MEVHAGWGVYVFADHLNNNIVRWHVQISAVSLLTNVFVKHHNTHDALPLFRSCFVSKSTVIWKNRLHSYYALPYVIGLFALLSSDSSQESSVLWVIRTHSRRIPALVSLQAAAAIVLRVWSTVDRPKRTYGACWDGKHVFSIFGQQFEFHSVRSALCKAELSDRQSQMGLFADLELTQRTVK